MPQFMIYVENVAILNTTRGQLMYKIHLNVIKYNAIINNNI